MSDEEKQKLLDQFCGGTLDVQGLADNELVEFLDALQRMYNARVWNCVDASGKWDKEWLTLSVVFSRVISILNKVADLTI